jgi:hypothetical protein
MNHRAELQNPLFCRHMVATVVLTVLVVAHQWLAEVQAELVALVELSPYKVSMEL